MPWGMFDDRYPANLKVRRLSDKAFRLDVTGVLWACGQLTDGQVYDLDDLPGIKAPRKALAELVARGRWHEPGHDCPSEHCRPITEGWLIHDWLEFNKSKTKVQAQRKAKADRQKRWRDKTGRADDGRFAGDGAGDAPRSASTRASRRPVTRPYPEGSRDGVPPPSAGRGLTWCGQCSDPVRRRVIDPGSGNLTRDPCPRCGNRGGLNEGAGA